MKIIVKLTAILIIVTTLFTFASCKAPIENESSSDNANHISSNQSTSGSTNNITNNTTNTNQSTNQETLGNLLLNNKN